MSMLEWFKSQNMFVKSLIMIAVIWGLLAVYVPGTKDLWHILREPFPSAGAGPTKVVQQPPAGSPIIVSGGSLWGGAAKGWQKGTNCDQNADKYTYCTVVTTTSMGDVLLLSNGYEPALPPTIPAKTGWVIHFTDYTADPHENRKQGVLLCSNATCATNKGVDSNSYVYIKPLDEHNSGWEGGGPSSVDRKLYFHDKEPNCTDGPYGGNCDLPYRAILSIDGQTDKSFICKDGHHCWVVAGCP